MKCRRCQGRCFLDRVFTDNKNYEIYCVICGDRRFINRYSDIGQKIEQHEALLRADRVI